MEEGYVGINLLVNGISYPLVVKREEEPYYRQAARLINEKLLKYKDTFATESSEKLITMVAIDIAFRRMKDTDLSGNSRISGKLLELTKLIDNTIEYVTNTIVTHRFTHTYRSRLSRDERNAFFIFKQKKINLLT